MAASRQTSPLRYMPTYQTAGRIFGPSEADVWLGKYRVARDYVQGWVRLETDAVTKLAKAQQDATEWREQSVAHAQRHLDGIRAGMAANAEALAEATARLATLGVADPL